MNDPTERMDKVMDEMCKTQKTCLAHCRPQLYPHFIHRGFYALLLQYFFIFSEKQNTFLLFHLHAYNFLQLVALII